jgi:hypothetical protein
MTRDLGLTWTALDVYTENPVSDSESFRLRLAACHENCRGYSPEGALDGRQNQY